MPVITTCPDCDKKLKVPDNLLGKKVKCPGCSKMFTAEDSSAPEPSSSKPRDGSVTNRPSAQPRRRDDDEEEDRPRSRGRRDEDDEDDDGRGRGRSRGRRDDDDDDRGRGRRRRDDDDDDYGDRGRRGRDDFREPRNLKRVYQGVAFGFQLCQIGGWVLVGVLALFVINNLSTYLIARSGSVQTAAWLFTVFIWIDGVAAFAAAGLGLTGMGLCLQVPSERDYPTWGMALAAFICAASAVVLYCCFIGTITLVAVGNAMFFVFMILSLLAGFAWTIIWSLFLKNLCDQIRCQAIGSACITWMVSTLIGAGVIVILWGIWTASAGFGSRGWGLGGGSRDSMELIEIFYTVLYYLTFATAAAFTIWHVLLLGQVQGAVESAARKK
jgi:hypothetical protein